MHLFVWPAVWIDLSGQIDGKKGIELKSGLKNEVGRYSGLSNKIENKQ